jgi:hypothetical protein
MQMHLDMASYIPLLNSHTPRPGHSERAISISVSDRVTTPNTSLQRHTVSGTQRGQCQADMLLVQKPPTVSHWQHLVQRPKRNMCVVNTTGTLYTGTIVSNQESKLTSSE